MKIVCETLEDTKKLAKRFACAVKERGAFVSLFGEIGAGKTAFVRFVLEALGVKKKVTSPSFVILNEYKEQGVHIPIYHFDLYRLENEGLKTIAHELREYSKKGVLTFVEWADFGGGELPFERVNIRIIYENDDARSFEFEGLGDESREIVEGLC